MRFDRRDMVIGLLWYLIGFGALVLLAVVTAVARGSMLS
jgi:hypothetical protein